MNRGDTVILIRPKRNLRAKLVELYDHYPAARIAMLPHDDMPKEKIVAASEIMSLEQAGAKARDAYIAKHAALLATVQPGDTWSTWHDRHGPNGPAWGIFSKLRRLGVEQVPIL